jgi:hypothetical protein
MGITDPALITDYVVNSIHGVDVLRIKQKRERGSLLPTRRSWEFPRVQQGAPDRERGVILSTSPILREITAELDRLLAGREHVESTVAALVEELQALEAEVAMRVHHIQAELERLTQR